MTGSPTTDKLALITGATAGLGAEFARQLAADGYDLVLVARDAGRLEQVAGELRAANGVQVEVLAADLVSRDGLSAVELRLAAAIPRPVTLLVNNAGFGLAADFEKNDVEDEQRLLDLLVTAPMRLSHAALARMVPEGSGTIINIASVAGFTPRGTYGAAKAWVLSFSRWANVAYGGRGVNVTGVAPGFVHTEFHDRMGVGTSGIPWFLWLDAPSVVRLALADVAKGKAISIPSLRYKVIVLLSSLLPTRIVAAGALRGR